ncbi:MAG: SurA N-terminal domain-containing protein [Treponema sp.]|nr:SurA N-terminal domain-containing protein [Treponema sp.]
MKRILIATFFALVGVFCATSQNLMQPLAVVKYNDSETITVKEVKDLVDTQEKEAGRKLTPQEREQLYEAVINQKLVLQAAKKAGVTVQATEVDQMFLQNISQQLGLQRVYSEKELDDLVRQEKKIPFAQFVKDETGMTIAEVKNNMIRPALVVQRYILSQKQNELQKIAATDKEIRDYYELNKTNFNRPDSLKLFLVAAPKQGEPNAKSKIESLLADLKSGKTSVDKIRSENTDPQKSGYVSTNIFLMKTPQHAASLGISAEQLLAMFNEPLNKPSDIRENPQSYQFYVILEKYPAKSLALSDVLQPDSTQTVYETIRGVLTQQKQYQFLEKARQDLLKSLNTAENVQRKKTGDELIKLLSW